MPLGRALALLFVSAATAAAQRYVDLYGRVLDTTEGGIGQAAVTVVNEETGFRRAAQSDPTGRYIVASLQPGSYKVTVRKDGFRTLQRFGVKLAPGSTARADFVLPVGSVEETITVVGTAPLVSHDDGAASTNLERADFERLPLNGRGMLTLIEMTPGSNVIPATRGDAGQFTASGQRANANYFTVDGVSANTGITAGGLPAQSSGGTLPALSAFGSMDSLISLEAVQEMKVTTSSSVAELGRLPGATVGLTSRSGSNDLHGSAAYRVRNEAFDANDWYANEAGYGKLPLRLHDFTGALGGAVRRNKSFFFLSYQRVSMLQPFTWLQGTPSYAARLSAADWAQPLVQLFPFPTRDSVSGSLAEAVARSNRPAGLHTGGARFDQALGRRTSLFVRYNDSPSRNEFGGLSVNRLDLRSQALTAGLNFRPTANTTADLRINESQAAAYSTWSPGDDCALQPLTATFFSDPVTCDHLVRFWIGGVGQFVSGKEGVRRQRQFQVVDSFSWRRGRHNATVGVDYRSIVAIRRDPTGTLALIADDLSALEDRRKLWIARTDGQNQSARVHETSLWIQDQWQPAPRLTIAAGLRWEYSPAPMSSPATVFLKPTEDGVETGQRRLWERSLRNFAPRFGAAWQLSKDGRTVIRAGGGLYYFSSMSIATDILNGGPLSITTLSSSVRSPASSLLTFGFRPDLQLPYVEQWSLSIERAVGSQTAISGGYVGSSAHLLLRREAGGPASSVTDILALTTNHGASNYHGFQAQFRRRMSRGVQAMASYTLARSLDNGSSDSFLFWAGPLNLDRARSDFDLRHAATVSGSYEPARLKGWALDAVLRARSGFPITVLQAEEYQGIALTNAFRPNLTYGQPIWGYSDTAPGGRYLNPAAFQATAPGTQGTLGRNAIAGFGMWQLDMAVRREFRLAEHRAIQVRLEAYNAFNHANFADPMRYLNSPVFGRSTSMLNLMLGTGSPGSGLAPILQTGGPRSLQVSLRFQY